MSEKKYQPKTKEELQALCNDESVYLGDIDTSKITDMSCLFFKSERTDFRGIETWDTSNVKNMEAMFCQSSFDGDISKWDVSGVKNMGWMFANSTFNSDISRWDVSHVETMGHMFSDSKFNRDISQWDVSGVKDMSDMFGNAEVRNEIRRWISDEKEIENRVNDIISFKQTLPKEWAERVGYKNPKEVKRKISLKPKVKMIHQDNAKSCRGDE